MWVKLVCRSGEKVIKSFKLGCDCYLEQKKHSCLYNKNKCLNCMIGGYVRPLSEVELEQKYWEYGQIWSERQEIKAQKTVKQQYKYDGVSYWAECSFCSNEIKGKQKHQGALSRNKVSFWTGDLTDDRVVCGDCLRSKTVIKELGIKGIRRQMLYNYRRRGIV